jgi:hypothetical protein
MNYRVAILQSNYIPWKGYFDLINMVDLFIFYDDVKYTKNDWRNRNKIKTASGTKWLTIPCGYDFNRLICNVDIKNTEWQIKHFTELNNAYNSAPFFKEYLGVLEDIYLNHCWTNLAELNHYTIRRICQILNIQTKFEDSRNFSLLGSKAERLLYLLKQADANEYISGPSARAYLNEDMFTKENILLKWIDYSDYPEYSQLFPPFTHEVSILDLIFNEGPRATTYMKSFM